MQILWLLVPKFIRVSIFRVVYLIEFSIYKHILSRITTLERSLWIANIYKIYKWVIRLFTGQQSQAFSILNYCLMQNDGALAMDPYFVAWLEFDSLTSALNKKTTICLDITLTDKVTPSALMLRQLDSYYRNKITADQIDLASYHSLADFKNIFHQGNSQILTLNKNIQEAIQLAKTPVGPNDPLLLDLWHQYMGATSDDIKLDWGQLGFQGDDPSTDFRAMGKYQCIYVFGVLSFSSDRSSGFTPINVTKFVVWSFVLYVI